MAGRLRSARDDRGVRVRLTLRLRCSPVVLLGDDLDLALGRAGEVKEEGRAKSGPEDTNATGRPPFAAVSDIGMCATSRCPISYASDSGDITLTK